MNNTELNGLPWGSVNLGHVVSRGLEEETRRSSSHATFASDECQQVPGYHMPYPNGLSQAPSYGRSGTDEAGWEDSNYVYSLATQAYNTMPM